MCGYDIYFGSTNSSKTIKNILSKYSDNMKRRGPDQSTNLHAIVAKNTLMLRHFRLSIIGEDNGEQPVKNEKYILLYNGEIFNFRDLGLKYFNKIYFSDTEFLFDLLIKKQFHIVCEFDGFFSFTLINRRTGEILCGRDRFGIKPLYKVILDSGLYFTTDIKLAYHIATTKSKKIQNNTVKEFFIFGNPLHNNQYLKNISEIEPGKLTRFSNNGISNVINFTNALEFESQRYFQSAQSWRYPNEKVQFSLSGGIDSTTVHSILSQENDDSLFLNYEGGGANYESDLTYARIQDGNLSEVYKTKSNLNQDICRIMDAYFEPYSGGIPSFWVYEQVRKNHIKVCYTGVGGDELFGGYGIEGVKYKTIIKALLSGKYDNVALLSKSSTRSYLNIIELSTIEKVKLLNCYKSRFNIGLKIILKALLKNQFLNACDRFGMYHGVEVRPPLLNVNAPDILYSKDPQKKILTSLIKQRAPTNDRKVGFTLKASDMVDTDFVQGCRREAIELAQDLLNLNLERPSDTLLLRAASFYHFYSKLTL